MTKSADFPPLRAVRTSSERIVPTSPRRDFHHGDGITPGNVDQGYVLRRLIRRAIREGRKLGIEGNLPPPSVRW